MTTADGMDRLRFTPLAHAARESVRDPDEDVLAERVLQRRGVVTRLGDEPAEHPEAPFARDALELVAVPEAPGDAVVRGELVRVLLGDLGLARLRVRPLSADG